MDRRKIREEYERKVGERLNEARRMTLERKRLLMRCLVYSRMW